MKKSELKELLREVLREEFARERARETTVEKVDTNKTTIYVSFQADCFDGTKALIYSVSKNQDEADSKFYGKDRRYFDSLLPNNITKLFLAEIKCTEAEAAIFSKAVRTRKKQTYDERREVETLLTQLIKQGDAEELDIIGRRLLVKGALD